MILRVLKKENDPGKWKKLNNRPKDDPKMGHIIYWHDMADSFKDFNRFTEMAENSRYIGKYI